MVHVRKTQVLRRHHWKTQGKQRCCKRTYKKPKENIGVALEPMENARKTLVLRGNQWKPQKNLCFTLEPMENIRATQVLRRNIWKRKENTGFAWKPMEDMWKTRVLHKNLWKTNGKHMFLVGTYVCDGVVPPVVPAVFPENLTICMSSKPYTNFNRIYLFSEFQIKALSDRPKRRVYFH